ncbi:MAG: helix-turn-helix transcriptional regulator, partial [Ktedonobacteraceae bacterium]|nr:helix-turn-helix transcriptional regulator [Ktedonobacteraceae bacterium]
MRQKIVNEHLVAARLARHWTQEHVCALLDVNVRTYQRWETEAVIPSPYFRQRLCEVFEMPLAELGIFPRVGRAAAEQHFTADGALAERLGEGVVVLTGQEAELFLARLGAIDMAHFDPQRR